MGPSLQTAVHKARISVTVTSTAQSTCSGSSGVTIIPSTPCPTSGITNIRYYINKYSFWDNKG